MPRASPFVLLIVGIVALAAVGFIVDLGSSSLFIDEVDTWFSANGPVGHVLTSVRIREASPPGYFFALKAWIDVFGDSVFAMRLPSALAGTATVASIAWVAHMLGGRVAAVVAALLAALSPVVLEYADQARPYGWAMLAVTLAVGCIFSYMDARRRPRVWLAGAVVASVAAVWIHYTAWFVIAPLAAWVLARREVSRQAKATLAIALLLAFAITAPLLYDQLAHGHHQGGIIQPASLSNIARVFGTPYDRLYNVFQLQGQLAGASLVLAGVAAIALVRSPVRRARRLLIAGLALAPPTVMVSIAALSQHSILFSHPGDEVVISRYTVVAAPFMIIALGGAAAKLPRAAGALLGAAALALAISATVQAHETRYHYPDSDGAMRFIAQNWRPGDAFVAQGYPGDTIEYYVRHLLPPVGAPPSAAPRIWTISIGTANEAQLSTDAFRVGYRLVTRRIFPAGVIPVQATLNVALPLPSAVQRADATRTVIALSLAVARRAGATACALLTPTASAAYAHLARAAHRAPTCAAGIAALSASIPPSEQPRAANDISVVRFEVQGERAVMAVVVAGHLSWLNLRSQPGRGWLVDP
jgi:mannosyltransferase